MDLTAALAFWGVSLLLVMTPGADWAYAITAGLSRRSVPAAVGGLLGGYVLITGAVAAGAAAVLARTPLALSALTLVGAAYLAWLGVQTVRHPPTPTAGSRQVTGGVRAQALRGAATSGLNPKALLLFLALLPQFVRPGAGWPMAAQIVLLGGVHMLNCAVVYTGVGFASRRALSTNPDAARAVSRASGLAMVAISLGLLIEQIVHLR